MPAAIPNGGGGGDITTSQVAAYHAAISKPAGSQTAQEQAIVKEVETKVTQVAGGWIDSGGAGGRQAAVALEVARLVGKLEADRVASVNQWAPDATGSSAKAKKAQTEMHGADTPTIAEMLRLLFEIRDRMNAAGIP